MAERTLDELFDNEFDKYPVIYIHPHKDDLKQALIQAVCIKQGHTHKILDFWVDPILWSSCTICGKERIS